MTPIASAVVLSNRPRRVESTPQGDTELTYLCPDPDCPSNDDVLAQMVPKQEYIGG